MILFSIEIYPRYVWSILFSDPFIIEWSDSTFLQTLNILKLQNKTFKLTVRFRFWKDRSRLGWEIKGTRLIWKGDYSKIVTQTKIGCYVYCVNNCWICLRRFWEFFGWKTNIKKRQSFVWRNLRMTLDKHRKLEIKIHQTPVI